MNLVHDIETLARSWKTVGEAKPDPQYDDAFERGYRAALRSCAQRTAEILDEHVKSEFADAVLRGVTS